MKYTTPSLLSRLMQGMHSSMTLKLFAFIILSVYFVCEVVFNSLLLDVTTNRGPINLSFSDVEVAGRALSSTGLCLFLYRYFYRKKNLIIVLPIVWISSFFILKVFVWVVVEWSTPSERQAAYRYVSIVAASDKLQEFRPYGSSSLVELSLKPGLMYFTEDPESNERAIILLDTYKKEVFKATSLDSKHVYLTRYDELYSEYLDTYNHLQSLYENYNYIQKMASNLAITTWNKLYAGHVKVRAVQRRIEQEFDSFSVIGPSLSDLIIKAHKSAACHENHYEDEYKAILKSDRNISRLLSNIKLCDLVSDGERSPPHFTQNKGHYKYLLLKALTKPYPAIEGVNYDYSIFTKVVEQSEFQVYLKSGNPTCRSYDLLNVKDFRKYYALCQLEPTPANKGKIDMLKIERGLDFYGFIANENLNKSMSNVGALVEGGLIGKVTSTDRAYYEREVLIAHANAVIKSVYEKSAALGFGYFTAIEEFNKGGYFYEKGRDSYRYITILPIVLSLNLFFAMSSFAIVVFQILMISTRSILIANFGVSTIVLLLSLPVLSVKGVNSAQNGYLLDWLIGVQPLIYELARIFR